MEEIDTSIIQKAILQYICSRDSSRTRLLSPCNRIYLGLLSALSAMLLASTVSVKYMCDYMKNATTALIQDARNSSRTIHVDVHVLGCETKTKRMWDAVFLLSLSRYKIASFAGTRTRVSRMRISYPNHLDYKGLHGVWAPAGNHLAYESCYSSD